LGLRKAKGKKRGSSKEPERQKKSHEQGTGRGGDNGGLIISN